MMRNFPEYKNADQLNIELQTKLDLYRDLLGWPVVISEGWSDGNGHEANSEHYTMKDGKPCSDAVDCYSRASLLWQFCCAVMAGFSNIGVYPNWRVKGLHLGIRKGDVEKKWIGLGSGSSQQYLPFTAETVHKYLT